jgi:hypothetical protein
MFSRWLFVLVLGVLVAGCDDTPPTAPSPPAPVAAQIVSGTIVPQNGGSVTAIGELPAFFVLRGSGGIVVPLTLTSGRDLPYAQLLVFLYTSSGDYCGANLPDVPSWTPMRGTDRITTTITGFQLSRVPCQVASIRAILHTRTNPNLFTPPATADIAAETTIPVSFTIN